MPNEQSIERAVLVRRAIAAPVAASRQVVSRFSSALFLTASTGAIIALFIDVERTSRIPIIFTASIAALFGIAMVAAPRVPQWLIHLAVAGGSILFAVSISFYADLPFVMATSSYVLFYACLPMFMGWVAGFTHATLAWLIAFTAVATKWSVSDATPLLLLIPPLVGMSLAIGILVKLASNVMIDHLTNLMNRRGFDVLLESMMSAHSAEPLSVALIDLDLLRKINDTDGQTAGDAVLRRVASIWAEQLKPDFTLARTGGDEFALLMPNTDEDEARNVINALRETHVFEFSAGLTSLRPGESASLLIGRADAGLYHAKKAGRGRTVVQSATNFNLSDALRTDMAHGKISTHLQPLVYLDNPGHVMGLEALARWKGPDGTPVPPDVFLPYAEDDGFILELGLTIARDACEALNSFTKQTSLQPLLFLNLTSTELHEPAYARMLLTVLDQVGISPNRLVIEVTETIFDTDAPEASNTLHDLRVAGAQVAIDDFGTGYSSLSRLHSLPADFLKLDRSFVSQLEDDNTSPILEVIDALGKALNMQIIAEGIEYEYQARRLIDLGFPIGQGWHYSKALPIDDLLTMFDDSPNTKEPI